MISPGRLWWLLRRDLKRGWTATYHDYKTRGRIREWTWPFWGETPMGPPVHTLTGASDWQLCAWMLASFFHFTEQTWRICLHDDGTLPESARIELKQLFRTLRIIGRDEADSVMDKKLVPLPFCHDYRNRHPMALKLFDTATFADADRYILLDSDILFFNHPREIMDWAGTNVSECWFMQDVEEASLISPEHAWDDLGVKLWPRVNAGLGLVTKSAIDFEFCERALGETSILQGKLWRVEQTLHALCASRHGKGGLLPTSYELSLNKRASPGCVARHYVGAVRDQFFGEGLNNLRDVLLAPERE